jgi:replicative DNA helicase
VFERLEPIKRSEESDEKYNEKHARWRELCEGSYNTAEIIISKQRHGPIGTIKTHFDSNFTKFSNLTNKDYANIAE